MADLTNGWRSSGTRRRSVGALLTGGGVLLSTLSGSVGLSGGSVAGSGALGAGGEVCCDWRTVAVSGSLVCSPPAASSHCKHTHTRIIAPTLLASVQRLCLCQYVNVAHNVGAKYLHKLSDQLKGKVNIGYETNCCMCQLVLFTCYTSRTTIILFVQCHHILKTEICQQ